MGALIAILIITAGALLTFVPLILLGCFSGKPTYDKKKHKRLVQNIYTEQMLVKQINEDLDSLPKSANIPFIGTRWWVRKDLKKMGLTL